MEILNVYITSRKFICNTYDGVIELSRKEFETWADDNQKREWIEVRSDHRGEPVEDSGTLSWREYYDSKSQLFKDVGEFTEFKNKTKT